MPDRTVTAAEMGYYAKRRLNREDDMLVFAHMNRTYAIRLEYLQDLGTREWIWSWGLCEMVFGGTRSWLNAHGTADTRANAFGNAVAWVFEKVIGEPNPEMPSDAPRRSVAGR